MREIKFRAWDKERKVMTPPDGICHLDGNVTKGLQESAPFWELMQFTGLHDKNGKEIYEGDILSIPGIVLMVVGFKDGSFVEERISPTEPLFMRLSKYGGLDKCEIIGNIYENKKLLEDK